MNTSPYTPEQLANKFIVCSKVTLMKNSVLATVTHTGGPHAGLPYLYNTIHQAKSDLYFDKVWDEVVPADEYFQRITQTGKLVSHE